MKYIGEFYKHTEFILNGGAVKYLCDFLNSRDFKGVISEPSTNKYLTVLEAFGGYVPDKLVMLDQISQNFDNSITKEQVEIKFSTGTGAWPGVFRIRGEGWKIFVMLTNIPENPEALLKQLEPFGGLIKLWQAFRKINEREKKLSRLSYMILATKSTLASIFEPMPLQYFASFLKDVLQESLFPKSIAILKDEGTRLSSFDSKTGLIPARRGIYAEEILSPTPVILSEKPAEIVLPITEGDCRLFCVMKWENAPDDQTMNFLELLGSLAVRALAINKLRSDSQTAELTMSAGDFTVMSLSNVVKVLKNAESKGRFFSLLTEVFLEQSRMKICLLATWDNARSGYTLQESSGLPAGTGVLISGAPVEAEKITKEVYDLDENNPEEIFKSWGLINCPWKTMMQEAEMKYLFPLCDDKILVGIIAIGGGSENNNIIERTQMAALELISQFAAYEFGRFEK